MIFFESTIFLGKKIHIGIPKCFKTLGRKELAYLLFLVLTCLCCLLGNGLDLFDQRLKDTTVAMEQYGQRLELNLGATLTDTVVLKKEREQLLLAIEERIVTYLYQIPDYSYVNTLKPYLGYRPKLLEELPSAVPLESADYSLSSHYGIRIHPISGKRKKHFGIDLAAPSGKPVYASASGLIADITTTEKGYDTYIVIKHRFGFETLYGHLSKILVQKGQNIKQHELIATVGNSGSATGYHLHYEIVKNGAKIDPRPSLDLKKDIYSNLIDIKSGTNGED